jgi:hypothetical protein
LHQHQQSAASRTTRCLPLHEYLGLVSAFKRHTALHACGL